MLTHRAPFAIRLGAACVGLLCPAMLLGASTARTAGRTPPPAWVAFSRSWAGIAGYSTKIKVFERKGARVQNVAFDYHFRKPSSATVRVLQGPNAGVTLVWNGESTMEAHRGSGFIAQFKKKMSLHDPLATTIRGSSIDQLSFGAILMHARGTAGTVSQARGPVIGGVATDAVRLIPTTSISNTGLTYEIVDISKATHFPLRVLGYEGRTLVRRIDFLDVKIER